VREAAAPVIPHSRPIGPTVPVALSPHLEATCAVCCGALAAGALTAEVAVIVRLLAGWLLADIILGFTLAQLLATVRVAVEVGPPPLGASRGGPRIPYTEPGSPGDRLAQALGRWLEHWRERLQPAVGHHVASFATASATGLLVGAYLGVPALAACAGTVALAVGLILISGPRVDVLARWYAGLALAVAWYLGHCLFAPVTPASWGMAALLGLAAFGRVAQTSDNVRSVRRGRRLVGIVWAVLVFAMLVARQPIAAGITAIAGLAECMSLGGQASRPTRVGWLAAMWLAAVIVAGSV